MVRFKLLQHGLLAASIYFLNIAHAEANPTTDYEKLSQRLVALEEKLKERDNKTASANTNSFTLGGYMTTVVEQYDFYRNAQDTQPERRTRADLERVVLVLDKYFSKGYRFTMELEIEHGGTGSAIEYEPEEFGEFESEVEHGGEVIIEQAYLNMPFDPRFNVNVGHIILPIGLLNSHHEPTEYYTIRRPLAETAFLPSAWHETGVEAYGRMGDFAYRALLVTGLDSAGFNSSRWIADGATRRLEQANADSLATVVRIDWTGISGLLVGGSIYYGDSAANRPLQNLSGKANVTIMEVHGRYTTPTFTASAGVIQGELSNAKSVNRANLQTFNPSTLGVSRTPVALAAESSYAEVAYNILSLWQPEHEPLMVFARLDAYDTMAEVSSNVLDNPAFDVTAVTVGLNYRPLNNVVLKTEFSRRENKGTQNPSTDVVGVALGLTF